MLYISSWPVSHVAAVCGCQSSLSEDVIIEGCLQAHQQLPLLPAAKLQNV